MPEQDEDEAAAALQAQVDIDQGIEWDDEADGSDTPTPLSVARGMDDILYTAEEIDSLPDPEWLLEGRLQKDSLAMLFGESGSGKSFLAMDWAFTLGAGLSAWRGEPVNGGGVLYVAAEGAASIKPRKAAWVRQYGEHAFPHLRFMAGSVDVVGWQHPDNARFRNLEANLETWRPALIVLDTLNKTAGAGDENSAKDMGQYVAGMDRLRQLSGACVLVVHHTGLEAKDRPRGSSALFAGMDTCVAVKKGLPAADAEPVLLTENHIACTKQKNGLPFEPVGFRMADGVMVPTDDRKSKPAGADNTVRDAMVHQFAAQGMSQRAIAEQATKAGFKVSQSMVGNILRGAVLEQVPA